MCKSVVYADVQKQENKKFMHQTVSAVTLFWSKIQVHACCLCQEKHELMCHKGIPPIYWQRINNTQKTKTQVFPYKWINYFFF